MKTLLHFLLTFTLLYPVTLVAEQVEVTVSAPSETSVGEQFRVVYTVNARPDQFQAPSFDPFRIRSGPSQSTSSSTQIINNRVTTSINISYTYVLEATSEGEFSIDGARVRVDGKTYESSKLNIKVNPRGTAPQQPDTRREEEREAATPGRDDIFIRAEVNNPSPYRGEQVIVTYKLYTRLDITNYNIERLPSFQGFWSEDITEQQPRISNEVIGGVNYRVAEIRRVAIFPQRSGTLNIDPMTVEMGVRVRRPAQQRRGSLLDEFFGGSRFDSFQTIQHRVNSNSVSLEVKPLPTENRPANFTGLVGSFDLESQIQPLEMEVNDATNLTLTITGRGNIRMVEEPAIAFPPTLEVFDARVDDAVRRDRNGIRGSRIFDFLIIPRSGGTITIPEVGFSYFDPDQQRYITRNAGPFELTVSGEDFAEGQQLQHQDVSLFTDEIRFIQTQAVNWRIKGMMFYKSRAFYVLLVSPVIILIIVLILYRRSLQLRNDRVAMRTRKAEKLARKRLKHAHKLMQAGNNQAFFDEIFRTLWGYVSDRLNIPVAQLNKQNVANAFRNKNVSEHLADEFLDSLSECEYARFAPAGIENPMQETYQKAMQTIVTIEKEMRRQTSKSKS